MTTIRHHATNWALGIAACFAILVLNAYLEYRHSETEVAALTDEVSQDRAAEFAAFNNQEAATVASKE